MLRINQTWCLTPACCFPSVFRNECLSSAAYWIHAHWPAGVASSSPVLLLPHGHSYLDLCHVDAPLWSCAGLVTHLFFSYFGMFIFPQTFFLLYCICLEIIEISRKSHSCKRFNLLIDSWKNFLGIYDNFPTSIQLWKKHALSGHSLTRSSCEIFNVWFLLIFFHCSNLMLICNLMFAS